MDTSTHSGAWRARSGRWARAHRLLLSVLGGVALLYGLAGFLLVPVLARHAIEGYVRQDLGRHVTLGEVRFNPFTLVAEVRELRLLEADDTPLAGFARLRVDAALSSVLHWAWTFKEIRFDGPELYVRILPDGSLNLAHLAPAGPPTPAPAAASAPPRVRIQVFGVHQGVLHYQDLSRPMPFATTLTPIEFDLSDFRTARDFENRYRFTATSTRGERFDWSGEFTVQPVGSSGEFAVDALRAATLTNYLGDALPFAVPSGSLDLNGSYQLATGPGGELALKLASLKLHDLALAPRGSDPTPWVTVPELEVADAGLSLNQRRVTVGSVQLKGAHVQAWLDTGGQLNLQQLLGAPATPAPAVASTPGATPAPATATPPATPWQLTLARFAATDLTLDAEDRTLHPAVKLKVAPLALTVQNYSSAPGSTLSLEMETGMGPATLRVAGNLTLSPFATQMKVGLKDFDLTMLQPYAARATDMTVYRGRLGADLAVAMTAEPARKQSKLTLTGALSVDDLATRDNVSNADFVTWQSVRIAGLNYHMGPDALSIDTITAVKPYGRIIINERGGLNVTEILQPTRGAETAAATPATDAKQAGGKAANGKVARVAAAKSGTGASASSSPAGMPVRIRRVLIEDGAADFTDHSIQPNFSSAMLGLKGSVLGLSSDPASRADIALDGAVDRYAPVTIRGQVNLLSAATYTDIGMDFRNMELTTFNPYSGKFAGYSIAQGKLSTELHYHVENRRLDAKHHIVIDQLEFGDATESRDAAPLPVKLAVALLKDRNGVITLDLPVGGSLDDPSFHVGPIVWKLFVGLLTKAVTAPFALLGSLFGGGEQLAYVDFPAGSALLPPDQAQKLIQLGKALMERPQLRLSVPLHTGSAADDGQLERTALEQALTQSAKVPRPQALVAVYRAQFGSEPKYPDEVTDADARGQWLEQQLLSKFAPPAEARDALGRARAEAVQSTVLETPGLDPARVFLTDRASGGGSAEQVRMDLNLQ
jgi:uncharacterized protein involved in outer membrane biogenesis